MSLFISTLRKGQGTATCEEDAASSREECKELYKRLLSFRSFQILGEICKMTEEEVNNLSPVHRAFYEQHVATSLDKSICMCSAEQGSPAWKKSRDLRLYASKARAQFTYFSNKLPDWDSRFKSLYLTPFSGNAETDRGLVDEVICREKYESNIAGSVLETGAIIRPELPWLSASPDGIVVNNDGHFVRSIEIKSFKEGTRLASYELIPMNAIPTVDCNGNIKVKNQHYAQMQLGMLLTGLEECDYCLWSSVDNNFHSITVPFDPKHVLELCSILVKVYFRELLPRMVVRYNFELDDDDDGSDMD